MKKVVVASLLAFSAATGMVCGTHVAFAQTQVNLGSQPSGGVQMPAAEYADYTAAEGQTDPKAKAPALEAYLTKYPQSSVKAATLQDLMLTYSQFDPVKTLDAADRLLQLEPNNLRALTLEVYFRSAQAAPLTDAAAKQAGFDSASDMAKKGIAATEKKPDGMDDASFAALKGSALPVFYSAIGTAALNKKDAATAIDIFKKELASVPVAATTTPGPILQDTYTLATAYYQSTPPDLLNCAFYAARAANYAPEPFKTQMMPLAKYCYKKFHGADDGFDAVIAVAKDNLTPPATYAASVKPAPTPAEIIHGIIASTPDLGTLAVADKELIFTNGSPEDSAKVWDSVKGKSTQFPDALVIAATDSAVQVAVSDDAVQSKTADFTFNTAAPLKTVPEVGSKVTISGTYASFTPSPIMITMSDAEVAEPKKAPVKKPAAAVHRAPAHK
jgi:hypothetical protein